MLVALFWVESGQLVLKIASHLVQVESKARVFGNTLTPEQREDCIAKLGLNNRYAKLVTQFRDALLSERAFTQDS